MRAVQTLESNQQVRVIFVLALVILGGTGCGLKVKPKRVSEVEIIRLMAGKWKSDMQGFEECEFIVDNPTIDQKGSTLQNGIGRVVGKGRTLEWGAGVMWFEKTVTGRLIPNGSSTWFSDPSGQSYDPTPFGQLWNARYEGMWNITSLNDSHMVLEYGAKGPSIVWKLHR
jgi:hypothetical protein